jgi:hypothetical protein
MFNRTFYKFVFGFVGIVTFVLMGILIVGVLNDVQ